MTNHNFMARRWTNNTFISSGTTAIRVIVNDNRLNRLAVCSSLLSRIMFPKLCVCYIIIKLLHPVKL